MKKLLKIISILTISTSISENVISCNDLFNNIKQNFSNFKINDIKLENKFEQANVNLLKNIEMKIAIDYKINLKDIYNDIENMHNIIINIIESDGTKFTSDSYDNWYKLPVKGATSMEIKVLNSDKYFKQIDHKYSFNLSIVDKRVVIDKFSIDKIQLGKNAKANSFITVLYEDIAEFIDMNNWNLLEIDKNNILFDVNINTTSGKEIEFKSTDDNLKNKDLENGKAEIKIILDKKNPYIKATNNEIILKNIETTLS